MVITKLVGGLGNQMFQYAAGYALAKRLNTKVYVDFSPSAKDIYRPYQLEVFGIKPALPVIWLKWGCKTYTEPYYNYDDQINNLSGNIYLQGYWTSEKYFYPAVDEIKHIFTYPPPDREINQWMKKIVSDEAVALHVRRGDYVNNPKTYKFHGICDMTYYQQAIHWFKKRLSKPVFYIFSDDKDWARENFKEMATVHHNGSDYEDMRLMSSCRHHIIANSTFSWWSAWLSPNTKKVIIAPKTWIKDKRINCKDVYPRSWITM